MTSRGPGGGDATVRVPPHRVWLLVVLAVVFVCASLAAAGYVLVSQRATERGAAALEVLPSTPAWRGEVSELASRAPLESHGIEIASTGPQCGLPTQDWQGGVARAGGQFCVVDLMVRNESGQEIAVAPSKFEITGADGGAFTASADATVFGPELPPSQPEGRVLPSGASTSIHLVFDVPEDIAGPLVVHYRPSADHTIRF